VPGLKTNEVVGTRAVLRHHRISAYKARQVLDLVRGRDVDRAEEILRSTPREAARVVGKVLASAVANARNNDQLDPDELYVSACYADEGTTLKRWRPRARGRATRIRKRTCHITVIVSRLPEDRLERRRARQSDAAAAMRARRVAASRRQRRGGSDAEETGAEETGAEAQAVLDAAVDEATGAEVDDVTDGATDTDTDTDSGEVEDVVAAPGDEDATADGDEVDEAPAPTKKAKAAKKAAPARKRTTKAAGDDGDDDAADEEKD
jgi:large subunit ribosomal protein L22